MSPHKALGPDGIPASFYQRCWTIVKPSLLFWIQSIFNGCSNIRQTNNTLISLIPKIPHPETLSHLQPIELCNVNYKILTKLIVQSIQPLMANLISEEQSSFISRRQIVDNIVIMQEAIHSMRTRTRKVGMMAIKVDLEKAYDRLKWSFIQETLQLAGFASSIITIIMECISSVNMQVLLNGKPSPSFKPNRGIQQGDPLSPYLFVLCMERLTYIIRDEIDSGHWKPLRFGKNGTKLSLFFLRMTWFYLVLVQEIKLTP